MRKLVVRFSADVSGAAAVEYGLIAAGLSLAIATLLQGIGARIVLGSVPAESSIR
jgi:pilus assembly protein Flp/PilA